MNRAKEEKQQLFIKLSNKLDQEKDEKLLAVSLRDKLQKKVFLLEEDLKKTNEKLTQKNMGCERLEKDLMDLRHQISNKDETIKGLYKKIDEKFEENVQLSQKHKDEVIKLTEENDKLKRIHENEKNKITEKTQVEIEGLNELKVKNMKEIEMCKKNIMALNDEIRELKGYNAELLKRLEYLQVENQGNLAKFFLF